jgi:anthranilate phosphoribosyltransferase
MSDAFKPLLARLADGQTLSEEDADAFFAACLRGEPTPAQMAAALTAMRLRGETVGELVACARAMRRSALMLDHPYEVVDVCGTGGDGLHTLNVSSAVGFVVAGAGVKVAKHGGRGVSSRSGAADVLTALGINIGATPAQERAALDKAGIAFLFAQAHHPAMKHVAPVRAELGFRTLFNLIGPLANPAGARRQVVGVPSSRFLELIGKSLGALGAERAWVVHGQGLDELTTTGESEVAEWKDGRLALFTVTPEAVGLPRASLSDLTGGDPAENAARLRALLGGETGPYRDIVLLNAAAALLVADKVETLSQGVETAAASIDQGKAKAALDALIEATNT